VASRKQNDSYNFSGVLGAARHVYIVYLVQQRDCKRFDQDDIQPLHTVCHRDAAQYRSSGGYCFWYEIVLRKQNADK
jgi:hypothetical protein